MHRTVQSGRAKTVAYFLLMNEVTDACMLTCQLYYSAHTLLCQLCDHGRLIELNICVVFTGSTAIAAAAAAMSPFRIAAPRPNGSDARNTPKVAPAKITSPCDARTRRHAVCACTTRSLTGRAMPLLYASIAEENPMKEAGRRMRSEDTQEEEQRAADTSEGRGEGEGEGGSDVATAFRSPIAAMHSIGLSTVQMRDERENRRMG